jgi:hypothetical protein
MAWKQTPESLRPSLRALARGLGTSHQLLQHYLDGLEKWQAEEDYRTAKIRWEEIRARTEAEGRPISEWDGEVPEVRAYNRAAIRAQVLPMLLKTIEGIKQEAKRGPLHSAQIKTLKMFAKQGFPEAQKILEKCPRVKKRKRFAEIVRETPRQEGETLNAWVQRIWDQCDKYETNCPTVITEELLQKISQDSSRGASEQARIICQ